MKQLAGGNRELVQRSRSAVWHPCTQMKHHERFPLVPVQRAEGVWLYDFAGHRVLDAISSWWVNLLGHCNPRINAALHEQLEILEHVLLAGFTHEPAVLLAERLSELAPGKLGHCFFGSDGASAVEIALKMSFHYWRNAGQPEKTRFVMLEHGYHGETIGALAVTDLPLYRDTYGSLLCETIRVPTPDARRAASGESAEAFATRCAQALDCVLEGDGESIAALILEPLVQCAAGMAMYEPIYLKLARESCDRHAVHLIADEIAVGFGRTGTLFACEQAPIAPDFLCLSKGLSGGYLPLSVVMTTDAIYAAFYDDDLARGFLHSHSYSGNPLACRAALATLDILRDDHVLATNAHKAAHFARADEALRSHPRVRNFRHRGMIWAFEVVDADPSFGRRLFEAAFAEGVLLRPIGSTVYFMPPYVISEQEIDFLLEATLRALRRALVPG
jgi:adenosylmethionine-8-amino-7-oxononanoate aminotransferase